MHKMKKVIRGNFSEEPKIMNMYEIILSIIDQKGPASIPSICQQVNQDLIFMKERDKPVQQAQVKSVISRKSDLFPSIMMLFPCFLKSISFPSQLKLGNVKVLC